MIKNLNKIVKKIFNIDGYIVPKNDEYFSEYTHSSKDRLKHISNFSGSAGFAVIVKNKNYLFVDGRYTVQAKHNQEKFKIITIPNKFPKNVLRKLKNYYWFRSKITYRETIEFSF